MSEQLVRQFVDLLYPPGSKLPEGARFSLWEMPGKRSYHYPPHDRELEIAAHALDSEGHNVFCGVGLRRADFGPHQRGTKADIVALPGFWADVDIKGLNHVADNLPANIVDVIQGILQPFGWDPSAVVNSGGGIHAYWLFEQPLWITDENRAEVEEMSRAFQERLALGAQKQGWKWDMTADTPRVLRPVGTHNRKGSDQGRAPVPVEFMGAPGEARYNYALFQSALKAKANGIAAILGSSKAPVAAVSESPGAPSVPTRTIDTRTHEEILDDLRGKMRKNRKPDRKPIIEHILNGEPFAQAGERDKVLQQVASWIGFYDSSADPEVLVEILIPSLDIMAAAQPAGAMTIDDAVEKISRAQGDARRKNALSQQVDDRIKAALMKEARGIPRVVPPADHLTDVAPAEKTTKTVSLAEMLSSGPHAALAVVDGAATTTSEEPKVGEYTLDEINDFIASQAELAHTEISFDEWKKRWIISMGDTHFIYVNGRYMAPIMKTNFRASAERDLCLLPEFIDGKYYYVPYTFKPDGSTRPKTADEVFCEISTVARALVADVSLSESFYDSTTQTFHEAVCPLRTDLTPRYDPQIQKWLEKLGGEDTNKLLDWIASVTFLQAPSCGLFLSGPPDTGKSVLANGLARLWHSGGYTRMEDVVGAFNADVAHCPLVVADETLPEGANGKPISTKRLRDIISADTRSLKRKHMANAALKGTIRCMFLANSEKLLDLGDEILGADSLAAVASRFLHIQVTHEASSYINSLGGRHGGTKDWVSGDQIARHALWLRDNRKVIPAGRFWVEGHVSKMHRMLASGNQTSSNVLEWIVSYLSKPSKEVRASGGILVGNGELWVNTKVVSEFWDNHVKTKAGAPTIKRIASAVEGLLTEGGKDPAGGGRVLRDPRGAQRRYFGLRVADVLAFAQEVGIGDPDELKELINTPREE